MDLNIYFSLNKIMTIKNKMVVKRKKTKNQNLK